MARGDHIFVFRTTPMPFQHHGVDLGDGTVVHFTDGADGVAGPGGKATDFVIRRTSMESFLGPGRPAIRVQKHRDRLSADEACDRAIGCIGHSGYDLVHHNCEHFAAWCVADIAESRQISIAAERCSALGLKAAAVLAARVGTRSTLRRISPWLAVADAAQFLTESCGDWVGIDDPKKRQWAGRLVGGTTAVAVGVTGGVPMVVAHGAVWAASEVAGEASRRVLRRAAPVPKGQSPVPKGQSSGPKGQSQTLMGQFHRDSNGA